MCDRVKCETFVVKKTYLCKIRVCTRKNTLNDNVFTSNICGNIKNMFYNCFAQKENKTKR